MPPRLARLLAAVLAIALVVGAFAVRGALSDDDADPTTVDGTDLSDPERTGEETFQVLCDADLGDAVCDAVGRIDGVDEVRVATLAEVLAAGASAGDDDLHLTTVDAWLTLDPMPGVLDEARATAQLPPLTTPDAAVEIGSASLSLLSFGGRSIDCAPAGWRCLAEAAATQDVGIPALTTSAGLAVAGAAFAAIGGDDVGARGIAALDGETADLLDALAEGAEDTLAGQQGTIVTQIGRYDGVVTTHGRADRRASVSATSGLVATTLEPEAVVGVVLAGLGLQATDAVAALGDAVLDQTVADLLAESGWDGEPAPSAGLPEFDVIYALRERLGR